MKVLIVGSGGREHALAWKIAQSPRVSQVWVAPGNAGTALEEKVANLAIDAGDIDALRDFAEDNSVDLTIVGPEQPLCEGIVDRFAEAGLPCFGPSAAAAQLEGSKAFSKDFMYRHGIPTAAYASFSELDDALDYLDAQPLPVVVKADGLAAGKGVIIAQTRDQARAAVTDMLAGNRFGQAGHRVVIEAFLQGEEASFIVMADGSNVLALATSQDHKAALDGDQGPNTGGMGAYSPAPVVDAAMHERILREVIEPTVAGMAADGNPFTGFLYAGVMIDEAGPQVLEFNVRFGDPETQPVMMRLQSDLAELCLAALDGRLDQVEARWDERACLGVVMAAAGYPGSYPGGQVISGLASAAESDNARVFHAGTALLGDQVVTAGGRVLCVCALGDSVSQARHAAYAAVRRIDWEDCHYRRDIGYRAVAREQAG